jgi:methyl-accepting chemotaxis protein
MSLQAQDIVRQQLEHVADGFADIEQHSDQRGILAQAATVQARQLATARSRIEDASSGLSSGLAQMGTLAVDLYEHFVAMETTASSAFGNCKLASFLREELERLSQISEQSEKSNRRISDLVTRVNKVIHDFSEKVSHQQFEVKLVALNAQIAAARLPTAGALNRLAEETSRVAEEVGTMNVQMTQQLIEVVETLRAMKVHADEFQEVIVRDRGDLASQSDSVSTMIESLQQGVKSETAEVRGSFSSVRDEINLLIASFKPEASISASFDPCSAFCDTLLEWCSQHPPEDDEVQTYSITDGRYTMESEYQNHNDVLASSPTEIPATTKAPELDKDIELF